MFERRSALASVLIQGGRDGSDGRRQLRIGEASDWSLTQIGSFPTTLHRLEDAFRRGFKSDLPERIGEVVITGARRLLRIGTEHYWIMAPYEDDWLHTFDMTLGPDICAVTPLSHSRTCISIEGSAAREILAKGIAIDLHSAEFKCGHFALTGLHHMSILVNRSAEVRYEIYALRTFARSVWDWLIDAALPVGYDVVVEK